ncbi:MAG: hypothetical protein JWR19_4113 [Pedosphaera sp.]|nr:hypothetical protein [Pedosphaera sp.]
MEIIMDETLPCLLNYRKLKEPISSAIEEITGLQDRAKSAENDEILLHGITVLGLAYYEVGLGDSLRYYLRHFPYKLKDSEIKFSKDVFIGEQFDLLEKAIDKFITSAAYKNFRDFQKSFIETTSIEPDWKENDLAKAQEFCARRNLLIHNRLKVNDAYQESSGLDKPPAKGTTLKIDSKYIDEAFAALLRILALIEISLEKTYAQYTRIKAIRELWKYLFKSPVMPFEDFWGVDEEDDRISYCRTSPHEDALSGAEKRMLGLWRSHFNGQGEFLKDFNMRLFDRGNQTKVLYFLAWNREHLFG